jgi:GMP synthase (glutamine-hydrolysing)
MAGPDPRTLWVIDPSTKNREEQGAAEVAGRWGGEWRLFRPALAPGDGPTLAAGHDCAGIVLMGSAASVHDEDSWLVELTEWLRPVVSGERPVPLLGICFGHQLIGHCAGAEVAFLDAGHTKRLGVEATSFRGSRLVPGERELHVVVSHREEVLHAPPGFRATATRRGVEVDALEHESRPVFGCQFHPEAREEFAGFAGIDPASIDERVRRDSRLVLDGFMRAVRASAR